LEKLGRYSRSALNPRFRVRCLFMRQVSWKKRPLFSLSASPRVPYVYQR
jgi:hypothetical protein